MGGWIKLHRQLLRSNVFNSEKLLRIWIWCLLKASHSESEQVIGRQVVTIRPGEFVFGRHAAKAELGYSESTIRRYIKILEQIGSIEVNPTNKYSIIRVLNWGVYQDNDKNNKSKRKTDRPTDGGTNEKQIGHKQEGTKNDKNVQEEYMYASGDAQVRTTKEKEATKDKPRSPFKSKIQEARFDEFWKVHPKKRSKGQAEKAWVKISPDAELFAKMLDGLERAKKSRDWIKDGGQYIPYPSTWLNAKGWEDDYSDIDGRPTSGLSDEDRAYIEESWAKQFGEGADV